MAKKIDGYIKLNIPAGAANPSPPVGPALGQRGVNIMENGTWKKAFRDNVYITPCCELPGHLHSGCKNVENVKEYKHLAGTRMKNYPEGRLDNHPIQQLYSHYCEIV